MYHPIPDRSNPALDKLIASQFTASLMNNAKWVKLMGQLVTLSPWLHACTVKLIWEEQRVRTLFIDAHTTYQHDYYASGMEGMLEGKPSGWYSYKEIEWIELALNWTDFSPEEVLAQVHQLLHQLGTLEMDSDGSWLRIFAYR